MKQFTKEQAIAFGANKLYEPLSYRERAELQLFQQKLCMPFDVFHEAIEKTLNRPVFAHEFAFIDDLRKEFLGEKPAPSLEEILGLIPKGKLIVLGLKDDEEK